MNADRLTVLVCAFNEAVSLPVFHAQLCAVLQPIAALSWRILYVDDGSTDQTWQLITSFAQEDDRICGLRLSRNFGKECAMSAGIDRVEEGAVVIIDADGQDPPSLINDFIAYWRKGYDNVYGIRSRREGEHRFKRVSAALFYRVIARLSPTPIPVDTGDFRLLSPRAVAALRQLRERHRFMKGLFGWIGFQHIGVPYHRLPRLRGHSRYSVWHLWNFALEGITSFSTIPLRSVTYLGMLVAWIAFLYGGWVVARAVVLGDRVPGWPSLMAVIVFLGGIQLIALGLIGEYLGRLYEEVKQRPLYIVQERAGRFEPAAKTDSRMARRAALQTANGEEVPSCRRV